MTLHEFKLLTDENIDNEVLIFLRDEGFDVFDIKEERLFSIPDRNILEFAYQNQRVVISQDRLHFSIYSRCRKLRTICQNQISCFDLIAIFSLIFYKKMSERDPSV